MGLVGAEREGVFGELTEGGEVGLDGGRLREVEEVLGGEVFLLGEVEGVKMEGEEGCEEVGFAGGEGGELGGGRVHLVWNILGSFWVSREFEWILFGCLIFWFFLYLEAVLKCNAEHFKR